VTHVTSIPHSSTGQAIVERAHQTLKNQLLKQKKGGDSIGPTESLAETLSKALYVLNYLRLAGDHEESPMIIHSSALKSGLERKEKILVQYKDLRTGQWEGP
ncbi:POK11 protein, partial [Centropus bengalensis]|nr:POK11 protein [Centropus bengalensis]NXX99213.1 POK11 protein [Centropus bengalensis]